MNLDQATERTYRESEVIALARASFPDVPEELIRSIFTHGFAMGSLYGVAEAATALEQSLIDSMKKGPGDALH